MNPTRAQDITTALRLRRDHGLLGLEELMLPLYELADTSSHLVAGYAAVETGGGTVSLPRFLVLPRPGETQPVRVALAAGLRGDLPNGSVLLAQLLAHLEVEPSLAEGLEMMIYPVANPTGYEHRQEAGLGGFRLLEESWHDSGAPEIRVLREEIAFLQPDVLLILDEEPFDVSIGFEILASSMPHPMWRILQRAKADSPFFQYGYAEPREPFWASLALCPPAPAAMRVTAPGFLQPDKQARVVLGGLADLFAQLRRARAEQRI